MKQLDDYISELRTIFSENQDRYKAHELSRPILLELARDKRFFRQIIEKNISFPDFGSQKRITPVVALDIEVNDMFSFIAHCWLPQPDSDTEMSNQSIHHHGDLLLTSVASLGPGYDSILFKKGFSFDKESTLASMEIEKVYKNPYMNIEFIDVNTPHIVFYPDDLSVTYALWSNYKPKTNEKFRKLGFLQKNRRKIRKLMDMLNLSKAFDLNSYQYVDFFPANGKVYVMKDRIRYPEGSAESFAYGFFSILSKIGYDNCDLLEEKLVKAGGENSELYAKLIDELRNHRPIEDKYEESHLNISKVNIKKGEVLKCFPAD
ncbi:MAG: hypothetical protein ACO1O6_07415 [Bacteroidota bacterium]